MGRWATILLQLLRGVQIGLLQHVGGIHPGCHAAVQSQIHHAAQPLAVAHEDLRECGLTATLEVFNTILYGGIGGIAHDLTHTHSTRGS